MSAVLFHTLRAKLELVARQKLNRNIGWLAVAELVSRLGRIFAAIILARQLDAAAFGIAAIALTIFEIVRVFTENGIGAAVVRADTANFHRTANTAYRLMWPICLGLALVQFLMGFCVDWLVPDYGAGLMVALLGLVFLIMPFGVLHAYCLIREERMKHLAIVATVQVTTDNFLTVLLALFGFGAWALVLPKILTAPIWLFGVRRTTPWRPDRTAGYAPIGAIVRFSLPVLGAELMCACRDQLDKIIVSLTCGVEALGVYFFAFNAGLGISTALNRAFSNAVYPHLCATADRIKAYRKAIRNLGLPFCMAYGLQAATALIYVPIIFGPRWAHAAPLVAIICLSGPARLLVDAGRMNARAAGRSAQDFYIALGFTVAVLVPFALFAAQGLTSAALASATSATVFGLGVTLLAHRETQDLATPALGVTT